MMLLYGFCLLLTASALVEGMTETCTASGVSYQNAERFTSVKADGSNYACRCAGTNCVRLVCTRRTTVVARPVTTTPPQTTDPNVSTGDGDAIGGEVVNPDFQPSGPKPVLPVAEVCQHQRRQYEIGETFLRVFRHRELCTCKMVSGVPTIDCQPAGCDLPKSPTRTNPNYGDTGLGGCYDSWNDRSYYDGERYNRTRDMSHDGSITGVYTCTCNNNFMRCSAVDIPCCDMSTGEYVESGSIFVTIHAKLRVKCMCMGGRGRYANCVPVNPGDRWPQVRPGYPTYPNEPIRVPRPRPQPRPYPRPRPQPRPRPVYPGQSYLPTYAQGEVTDCYDQRTKQRYSHGQTFSQNRGTSTWRCTCTVSPTRASISCNWHHAN